MQVDPLERFMILLTRSATKLVDRWEISDVALELYDLREKKITRTIPWPGGEVRENVNIRFSPDGKLLYFFGDDILIVETEKFTEVDTWALSRPIEQGLGRVSFGAVDDVNDDPGFFTGLFSVQDPVQNRRIMGIGRVNLVGKSVEFHPVGPAEGVGFAMAPDRKRGYGLLQQIGRYEFWTFDLEQKKLLNRTMFDGRPRMALRVSSNGRLLYVFQAGATIDVYEASTFKYLRTIEMNCRPDDQFVRPAAVGWHDGHRREPVAVESPSGPRHRRPAAQGGHPTQNHFGPSNVSTFNPGQRLPLVRQVCGPLNLGEVGRVIVEANFRRQVQRTGPAHPRLCRMRHACGRP